MTLHDWISVIGLLLIVLTPVSMVLVLTNFRVIRLQYMRKHNRACINCDYCLRDKSLWDISLRCILATAGYDPVRGCGLGFELCSETVGTIKCNWKKKKED